MRYCRFLQGLALRLGPVSSASSLEIVAMGLSIAVPASSDWRRATSNCFKERHKLMKFFTRVLLVIAILHSAAAVSAVRAQSKSDHITSPAAASQDPKDVNLQAYIDLLRKDVRQQKAEIMGAVMVLSTDDAAKFWPIYSEYDTELTKLNNKRVENIKEYARTYDQMTDAKADELIQSALAYQKERGELLAKTYGRVKQALGAVTAARFVQVEHQLLLIIDLQIISSVPIVSKAS